MQMHSLNPDLMRFTNFMQYIVHHYEMYSEPCQRPKIELFAEIVNGFKPPTIFAKSSILDVLLGSGCVSANTINLLHKIRRQNMKANL